MALFGFGKKKEADASSPADATSAAAVGKPADSKKYNRDPHKGERFFEHAHTVADSKQWDYAVELYISGLRHDPDNMAKHEALLEVAKRRKVAGGKPAGMGEKFKTLGSETIDRMLQAEKIWAMDFTDPRLAYEVMKLAVAADQEEGNGDYALGEVAFWIGSMAMDFNATSKKPSKSLLLDIRDRFSEIGRYDKAVEANRRALSLDPSDDKLLAAMKDLEAQRYTMERKDVSKTLDNVKDKDQQEEIQRGLSTHGGGDANAKLIASRKADYEQTPDDMDKLNKLVDAMLRAEDEEHEEQAIKLLQAAFKSTGQYRHKLRAGDIRMKQHQRTIRNYKQFVDAAPGDEEYKRKLDEAVQNRLDFELVEFAERVKNYPTDLRLKYELGRRQYQAGKIDDAIGSLQQATGEPKSRSGAHLLLGKCFFHKGWTSEAITTLEKGLDMHDLRDDTMGKELQYDIMLAYLMLAEKERDVEKLKVAQQYASSLLQADISYRDIRDRMQQIRTLSESLSA